MRLATDGDNLPKTTRGNDRLLDSNSFKSDFRSTLSQKLGVESDSGTPFSERPGEKRIQAGKS